MNTTTTCMCPNINCRKLVSVPEETRGKVVRCAHCQGAFRVPPARSAAPAPIKKSA